MLWVARRGEPNHPYAFSPANNEGDQVLIAGQGGAHKRQSVHPLVDNLARFWLTLG